MQGNLKPTAWQTSGCPKLPSERSHRDCHPRAALSTRDRLGVPSLLQFTCKNSGSKELPWQGTILPHPWERASAQSTKYCTLLPSGSTQTIPVGSAHRLAASRRCCALAGSAALRELTFCFSPRNDLIQVLCYKEAIPAHWGALQDP